MCKTLGRRQAGKGPVCQKKPGAGQDPEQLHGPGLLPSYAFIPSLNEYTLNFHYLYLMHHTRHWGVTVYKTDVISALREVTVQEVDRQK